MPSPRVLSLIGSLTLWTVVAVATAAAPLPGTQPLTWNGDISLKMVDDLHAFADRETAASIERRAQHWKRDFSSPEAYEKSIEPNRERLAKLLGVQFESVAKLPAETFRLLPPEGEPKELRIANVPFELVRWPTFRETNGYALYAESAADERRGAIILLGDEHFRFGKQEGGGTFDALVQRFHRAGYDLFVWSVVDRDSTLSTIVNGTRQTGQPHREFLYRQSFEMGRHVLGYEVERIHSLIDGLTSEEDVPIGVYGIGDGGRVALMAAALDTRIDVAAVSGAFGPQEAMHEESIDRNLWGFLNEFGDAELASLIAPRHLVIETSPDATFELPAAKDSARVTPGMPLIPRPKSAREEVYRCFNLAPFIRDREVIEYADRAAHGDSGTSAAEIFLRRLNGGPSPDETTKAEVETNNSQERFGNTIWTAAMMETLNKRTITELIDHTQALVRESEYVRKEWWKNADRASRDPEKWRASCASYRKHLYDEVLGRFDMPKLPPNARTRQIYDTPKYAGYEVVLDVFGKNAEQVDVWAYGVLLVPKDLKSGERRPVVVCQHGLEGRPQDTIEATVPGERYYHRFAAQLAERGFVVFAPQNPYIGKNHFRQLVRKLWPLKKTLWSVIVPQHEQITDWLASLPFVDGERIGFYGLSYGGKTAMRVPALVERYCLSICSGDFNEWIRKCTSVRDSFSYMGTGEYEMFEFDLGHTFNYAEMAYLIAPRPFMVERGHRDGVGIDEWVSYEYAKVRMLYADLKIPERTEIEYFDGPHEIHGVGTFDFLHKHLQWPRPD